MLKRITAFFLASLMMMLTCGAVFSAEGTNSDLVKFGVFSDVHSYTSYTADAFDDIYKLTNNGEELDGVIMNGDIVYVDVDETPSAEHYAPLLALEKYQELKAADKLIYVMGNHEMTQYSASDLEAGAIARAAFEEYTGFPNQSHRILSGYHFITSSPMTYDGGITDYEEYLKTEIEKALEDGTDKPVFLAVHHPIPGTVEMSPAGTSANVSEEFKEFLNNQPRLVVLTGHTHHPEACPRSIRQYVGGCTYVQTSQLMSDSGGVFDGYSTTGKHKNRVQEAMMIEVEPDTNIVKFRRFYTDGDNPQYLDGGDLVIDIPAMIRAKETQSTTDDLAAYKYTFEERSKASVAPVFAEGSKLTLSGLSSSSVNITVPAASYGSAGENNMPQFYEYKLINVDEATVVKNDIIISDYFLRPENRRLSYTHFLSGLSQGTNYRVEVRATNPWYKQSKPLALEFTTLEEEVFETVTMEPENTILVTSENISNDDGSIYHRGSYVQISESGIGHRFTATFNIEVSGMYRFMAESIGSEGIITKAVISSVNENGEKTVLKTSERFVSTGGATKYVTDYPYADLPLTPGTYTMTWSIVDNNDGKDSVTTLDNVKAARFAPLPEEYLDEYVIEKTASEYSDTSETVEDGITPQSFTLNADGYVTWQIKPDYTGIYKLSYDTTLQGKTTVISEGVAISGDGINVLPVDADINGEIDLQLLKNVTYNFTFKASSDGTVISGMRLIWQEDFTDLINDAYKFTYNINANLAYGNINDTGASSVPAYLEKSITVPYDANYTFSINAGIATTSNIHAYIARVSGGTVSVEGTGSIDTISNRVIFKNVPLKAGIAYKITLFNGKSGSTIAIKDVVFETSGEYLPDTDSLTFLASDFSYRKPGLAAPAKHRLVISASTTNTYNINYKLKPGAGSYKVYAYCRSYTNSPKITMSVNGTTIGTYTNSYTSSVKRFELGTIKVSDDEFTLGFVLPKAASSWDRVWLYRFELQAIEEPVVTMYSGTTATAANVITSLGTETAITAKAFLPKDVNGKNINMILAVYKNNALYKLGMYEVTGKKNTVTAVTLDELELVEGEKYSTKVFFTDGMNSLTPLYQLPAGGMIQSVVAE